MEAGGRGRPPPRAQGAPGLEPEKGKGDAGYGVENPEEVAVVVVDHHVAADLLEWQVIPPYLQQADGFEGEDVEDEDVERVVADEYQQTLQRGFPAGDQGRQIVDGDEACDAGRVLVNGKTAKASLNVKNGDVLEIQFGNKTVKAEILDVKDTAKKDEAKELFRYL